MAKQRHQPDPVVKAAEKANWDAQWAPDAWKKPTPTRWVDIVEHGRVVGQVDLDSGMRIQSDMTAGEQRNQRRLEQRYCKR